MYNKKPNYNVILQNSYNFFLCSIKVLNLLHVSNIVYVYVRAKHDFFAYDHSFTLPRESLLSALGCRLRSLLSLSTGGNNDKSFKKEISNFS